MKLMQEYLDNLEEIKRLTTPTFPAGCSDEEMVEIIRNGAHRQHTLRCINDQILHALLDREPRDLTPAEADQLFDFSDRLFRFARGRDTGTAHKIHHLLYAYAVGHGDTDMEVRELYYLGLSLHYLDLRMDGINVLGEQVSTYFHRAASFLDRYELFTSTDTRGYIIRSLANRRLGDPRIYSRAADEPAYIMTRRFPKYQAYFEAAMEVIQSPHYRKLNPDLPWDSYAYALHFDRTVFLAGLREEGDETVAKAVLESAEYVYRRQEQIALVQDRVVAPRIVYVYAAARYHAGRISGSELLDTLLSICEHADPNSFSDSGITENVMTVANAVWYGGHDLTPAEAAPFADRLQWAIDHVMDYLRRAPRNEYSRLLNNYAMNLLHTELRLGKETQQELLRYFLVCHPPTFVHSHMVAWLARTLVDRMIDVAPEQLVGMFDLPDAAAVRARKGELCDRIYRCGLYHDMGKTCVLNYITVYWRELLSEELHCIQQHPELGYNLLCGIEGHEDEAQVALRHHIFYDGTGGYPLGVGPCPAHLVRAVSAINIADVLDAATDDVGRSYATSKTLDQVIAELRRDSGHRYDPAFVTLLEDPTFTAALEPALRAERRRLYCLIYQPDMPLLEFFKR
jgi:hypothetical protein